MIVTAMKPMISARRDMAGVIRLRAARDLCAPPGQLPAPPPRRPFAPSPFPAACRAGTSAPPSPSRRRRPHAHLRSLSIKPRGRCGRALPAVAATACPTEFKFGGDACTGSGSGDPSHALSRQALRYAHILHAAAPPSPLPSRPPQAVRRPSRYSEVALKLQVTTVGGRPTVRSAGSKL